MKNRQKSGKKMHQIDQKKLEIEVVRALSSIEDYKQFQAQDSHDHWRLVRPIFLYKLLHQLMYNIFLQCLKYLLALCIFHIKLSNNI